LGRWPIELSMGEISHRPKAACEIIQSAHECMLPRRGWEKGDSG
jgi:hypothetical protein